MLPKPSRSRNLEEQEWKVLFVFRARWLDFFQMRPREYSCPRTGQTYLLNLPILTTVLLTIASRSIAKMAPSQRLNFLTLPQEIRGLVYVKLFTNTQLVIKDGNVLPGSWKHPGSGISNKPNNAAMIAVCKQLQYEAQFAMYSCTTITFCGTHGPDRVHLDNDLRRRVKRIIMDNGLRPNNLPLAQPPPFHPPVKRSIGGFTMSALLPFRSLENIEIAEFDVNAYSPRPREETMYELNPPNSPYNQWLLGQVATQLLPQNQNTWPVTLSTYQKIKDLPYEYHESAAAVTSTTHRRFRIILHVYCHVTDVNGDITHTVRFFVKSVP